ncbi:unnamed protein product [Coffea canephora]|uniref:Phytocyanin domain-containing protein n=1 Tax=Coffea canephora TaxID=49390 RepID=A0A068UP13_COFCA|nr:unnamed protein product [Coffea canephora]
MASSLKTVFPCFALVFFLFSLSEAREFLVGGKGGSWKIPSYPDEYNKWAEKNRFQIGDYLVLEYDKNSDSVLEVVESDYRGCSRGNPVKEFHDGNTKIQLDRSGPFYFISGADGHCEKGEKLIVRVLAANHTSAGSHSPAPAPSPSALQHAPAPAAATAAGHALKLGFMGWLALMAASLIFVFAMA